MEQLLKELKRRIERENRPSEQLYVSLKQSGAYMFMTNTMNQDLVLSFCAAMLKLYCNLTEKHKEENS
jgi:hypothetical protein